MRPRSAHGDGQQAAFRSLLKRIVPVTAYDRLKRFPVVKAGDLVDGMSVRQSATPRPSTSPASTTFRAEGVRALLRREGVPFIDVQAPELLVVPVVRDPAGAVMPTSATWTDAWQGLDLERTLTPVKLSALKPTIGADVLRQLSEGDVAGERALARAYGTDRVVAALAELDADGKRVTVLLTGADAVGPIRLKRSYRLPGGDLAYGVEMAAVVSLGVLEGRWKTVQMRACGLARSPASATPSICRWSSPGTRSGTTSAARCSRRQAWTTCGSRPSPPAAPTFR